MSTANHVNGLEAAFLLSPAETGYRVDLTPAEAQKLLPRNTRNRPISRVHVERLKHEMINGRWQFNGEAIKWSSEGTLLDGQHRLTALAEIQSEISVPFFMIYGLSITAQDTMDQPRIRSAGDQLAIDGLAENSDSKTLAGAIRLHIQWKTGRLFGDQTRLKISTPEVIQWAKDNPDSLALMHEIMANDPYRKIEVRGSLSLCTIFHFSSIDREDAREFAILLAKGAGLFEGNPIHTLRERLHRIRTTGLKMSDRDYIAFFVQAWNAFRENRTMLKYQRPRGGSWSRENFPKAV